METWAGINAPAGRKKDQRIGMHPMQAVCRHARVHPYDSLRASSSSRGCKKPGAQHEKYYSTKGIKSHKYIYRELRYLHEYTNTELSCQEQRRRGKRRGGFTTA